MVYQFFGLSKNYFVTAQSLHLPVSEFRDWSACSSECAILDDLGTKGVDLAMSAPAK